TLDILANDFDVDGDLVSLVAIGRAEQGNVTITPNGRVVYTPPTGFIGIDRFIYFISDGQGGTASGTVQVNVSANNNLPPDAVDDTGATNEDTIINAVAPGVLGNDTGDALTVTAF